MVSVHTHARATLSAETAHTNQTQAAREANIAARTLQRKSSLSVNHASTLAKAIRDETVSRHHWSLLEVFSGIAGNVFSGTPSELTGSGSGSVNWLINLLDAGTPNF